MELFLFFIKNMSRAYLTFNITRVEKTSGSTFQYYTI